MRIGIGSDDAGLPLKAAIVDHLKNDDQTMCELTDYGVGVGEHTDYPDVAERVAMSVARGEVDRGVLVCGTGIGMSIAANKIPNVRAALCHDVYSAERARKSNDADVLTLGARVIGIQHALMIVDAWLGSEFAGGRSGPKVAKLDAIDRRYRTEASSSAEET